MDEDAWHLSQYNSGSLCLMNNNLINFHFTNEYWMKTKIMNISKIRKKFKLTEQNSKNVEFTINKNAIKF